MESLPNGPWQCSILRVVSYAANILHSRRKRTLFLALCLLQIEFHFHLHSLLFVSVVPLYHLSVSLRRNDGWRNTYWNRHEYRLVTIISALLFPERPSHQFQINQVEHILATDYLFLVLVYT